MPRSRRLLLAVAAAWLVAPPSAYAIANGEDADVTYSPWSRSPATPTSALQESTATADIGIIELATPIEGPVLALAPARSRGLRRPGRVARPWGYGLPMVMADVAAFRGWIDRTIRRLDR